MAVDLRELSRASYHDQTISPNCKIGWNFFNRLQQQAKVNFKDMKLAKSILLEDEEVLDPATNKPNKTVMWPATKQTKSVPLLKELPDNSLKDLIMDTRDLMCFGENDIKLLAQTQIRSDP
ncbi:hypothetical protein Hanom_Chr12g01159941 [Helianthus anomalus]